MTIKRFLVLTKIFNLILGSAIVLALAIPEVRPNASCSSVVLPRAGTPSEEITYILPIWEGASFKREPAKDLSVLDDMKTALGLGGIYTKLGWSFSSWALSRDIKDSSNDYTFNPANLNYMMGLAVSTGLPILVHMNNGRWADCCTPNSDRGWGDDLLDFIASKPDTTMLDSTGASQYAHNYGENFFCLSRLNKVYRYYKQRNIIAAAHAIAEWAKVNPSLFAGVSLSSETMFPKGDVDFNRFAIEEWKMWMRNTGLYGPGGEYFGQGRVPLIQDIHGFNRIVKQAFTSWASVNPPATIIPGDPFAEEWQRWRVQMIINHVSDETLWIASAGIDRNLIFGHATPRLDDYALGDAIETATAPNGAGGVTFYGWDPAKFGEVTNAYRGAGKNNWGVLEINPLSTDTSIAYDTLLTLYKHGAKVMCPNSWESDMLNKDQYAIFDSPLYGNTFGNIIKHFLSDYANKPRNLQPPSWNPGNRIIDFYDLFSSATLTGIDNHREPRGSVGNVVRKSIFSHVDGTITYAIKLPLVTNEQRLNFWTSVGIKDGAGSGGNVEFQATINGGTMLFGSNFRLQQTHWTWNHWTPIMADITNWAGQSISFTLSTRGNTQYGWTMWGSPTIYIATAETSRVSASANNLAFRAPTTASSEDGSQISRTSSITDGTDHGWSSISHTWAATAEWVILDLESKKVISKVVLFPQQDPPYSGTGFPTAFEIQTSDKPVGPWRVVVKVRDYPRPRTGNGEIFTFESTRANYVRVYATVLGGVSNENGYRFQMAEVEIFE